MHVQCDRKQLIYNIQLENNLLSQWESGPTILLKLSQPNGIPSVWHTLILREFHSIFPLLHFSQ